eukprot:gene10615-7555_t
MMPNAWQYRFFAVTKDGILLYFDTEIPDVEHLETKARGKLDLKAANFEISTDAIEGAPTQHAISIAAANEEKWKMCSETKEDQARWLKVFTKYTLPENKSLARGPVSYTSDDDDRPPRGLSRANTTMTGASTSLPSSSKGDDVKLPAATPSKAPASAAALDAPSTKGAQSAASHPHRKPRLKGSLHAHAAPNYDDRDKYEIILVLAIVNVCFVGVLRAASWASTLFFLLMGNFVVAYTLQLRSVRVKKAEAQQKAANEAAEKASQAAAAAAAAAPSTSPDKTVAIATAVTASGKSSTAEGEEVSDKVKSKPVIGTTLVHSEEDHRTAPPARQRVDHAAERFQLPDTSNINTHHAHVPPIFVVQLQIPSEPPKSMFSSSDNGPGWALVMYYRITEDTCQQLKDLSTASPAVKLWAEWCEKAQHDAAMRARFKVINMCSNMEQLGFSSVIVGYNGKPVLIRRTGSLFRGANYMEFDVHVHKFDTFAKQGIFQISSLCGNMHMQVGFVIEGRDDSELPETLFGCVAVNRPQEELADFLFDD